MGKGGACTQAHDVRKPCDKCNAIAKQSRSKTASMQLTQTQLISCTAETKERAPKRALKRYSFSVPNEIPMNVTSELTSLTIFSNVWIAVVF